MEGEEGAEEKGTTQTVIKMVEQDQKDKALAVKGRDIPGMPGQSILVINRYAARAYREEFLEYINLLVIARETVMLMGMAAIDL